VGESVQNCTDACDPPVYNARMNGRTGQAAKKLGGGLSMTDLKFPQWQESYLKAMMETDQWKLSERVSLAEIAILSRLSIIQGTDQRTERQAIEDALNGLIVLKNETADMKSSQSQPFDPNYSHMN
jgi:hypothetical protein